MQISIRYNKAIRHIFLLLIFAYLVLDMRVIVSAQDRFEPTVTVIAEGLLNPVGLAALSDGTLFIAEEGTGDDDLSAGVSVLLPDGTLGRLISGLPSSRDSGDLSGVPLVGISPDETLLYVGNFGTGHLWTLPLNPDETQTLPDEPLQPDDLEMAMMPLNRVQVINPFDITFDANGVPVVTDASGNGVAKAAPDGTTRFIHRFDELVHPDDEQLRIDPVPTGITRIGEQFYVTLTGGCPFPIGGGELVAIDESRNQRTVVDNLNMPIDVAQSADGTIWVLEFTVFEEGASCFTGAGYQAGQGRLSRIAADGMLETIVDGLDFPGAVLPLPDGSLLISEIFSGHIIKIELDATILTQAEWHFDDVAADIGLDFQHGAFRTAPSDDPAAMMGAGLCWLDYDNDGWLDLYLVNSHAQAEVDYWQSQDSLPRNALYRNLEGRFSDVSEASGAALAIRGNGCVAADFNRDGRTDIYITADGPNQLLWNNGDGTFSEGARHAGLDAAEWNSAAVVGDLNRDGWPDLFVGSYIDLDRTVENPIGAFPQDFLGLPDYLYINEGLNERGRVSFREVALEVNLVREERTLGAIFSDLDLDGDLDLYIANDGHPNRLYENVPVENDPLNIGFRFRDLTDTAQAGDAGSGMGVTSGDFDGDGLFDLFVTNWQSELHAMYRNEFADEGFLRFRYSTFRIGWRGLGNNLTGWGTTWADFDHDTDADLLIVNGMVPITDIEADKQPVRLYGNRTAEGRLGQYFDWSPRTGLDALPPLLARGSAVADYDNDGDLDVAINSIGGPVTLLQNEAVAGNWLQVTLDEFDPGTIVTVTLPNNQQLRRQWHAGSSYLASEDARLHFGLGSATILPHVAVRRSNGDLITFVNVQANQVLAISN